MTETYFSLFDLSRSFALNETVLERRYLDLQRQCHPDRFVTKPAAEKQAATQMAVRINDAYQTLKSPLKRAEYLLSLAGIRVGGENDSVKPSPELLMEVMEFRERLGKAGDEAARAALREEAQGMRAECLAALEKAFAEQRLDEAAQHALRLRYTEKTIEALRPLRAHG